MFGWRNILRREKLGLYMIGCSLLVVAIMLLVLAHYQQRVDLLKIRAQGLSLAQLVSEVPFEQLLAEQSQNTLHIVYQSQPQADLAYAAVVDKDGMPLAQITAPGVLLPAVTGAGTPGGWLGERDLTLSNGAAIIEYYAPVLSAAEHKGFIRIGYYYPRHGISVNELPYMASIALPVFLLTPLFYFLLRREIRPLQRTHKQVIEEISRHKSGSLEVTMSNEFSAFASNFNDFFNLANKKIAQLEHERSSMLASSKILDYKFNKFEAMLEAIPDALIVFDESGTMIFANAKLRPMIGVAASDALSRPLGSWCDNSELFHFIVRCQKSKSIVIAPIDIEMQHGPVNKRVSASAHPLFAEGDQHKLLGRLLLLRDTSKEAAAQASRDEFIAHISHELKAPLHAMGLYIEELQGSEGDDQALRVESLNILQDETEKMGELISNILNITKIENGSLAIDRRRVRLGDLLNDALTSVKRSEKSKGIEFIADIPNEVSAVAIDKNLMRVAINNLLTNAVKYNRPQGTVTLELEELQESVRISVKDSGIGIAEQDVPHIFEKFYRSDSAAVRACSGHGLGLALVRDIVTLHNGTLNVSSEADKGTEIIMELYKESEQLRIAS